MTGQPPTRALTEDDLDKAATVLASIRNLIDPMSGRIDNWTER